jgi:hypothetical protein
MASVSSTIGVYAFSKNLLRHSFAAIHSDVFTFTQPFRVPDR